MFSKNRLALWGLMLAIVAVLTACGSTGNNANGAKTYQDDGLLGITSANPNLVLNPTYHNYDTDINYMRQLVTRVDGVQDAVFQVQGALVRAQIKTKQQLSAADRQKLISNVYQQLSSNMPRYRFKVTVR